MFEWVRKEFREDLFGLSDRVWLDSMRLCLRKKEKSFLLRWREERFFFR